MRIKQLLDEFPLVSEDRSLKRCHNVGFLIHRHLREGFDFVKKLAGSFVPGGDFGKWSVSFVITKFDSSQLHGSPSRGFTP